MVIDHARSLHVGVTDSGTEKFETPLFHILANGVGYRCTGRKVVAMIHDGLTIGHKAVQVFIKRAEFLLYLDE